MSPPGGPAHLSTAARAALEHVTARSRGAPLRGPERVCLHFHPDRPFGAVPILVSLASDGVYRSQFETGISNGGLTAHPGGDRWRWESRMFGGAYDRAPDAERPKYGALDFRGAQGIPSVHIGPAPRFGSSHLRLRAHVLERTTFCYPDSVFEPEDFGVAGRMALRPGGLPDPLDDYVEAHVHGPLRIDRDVEALVLDPCYRGTEVERQADRLGCAVEWHGGFRLSAAELRAHPDYRGERIVQVGLEVAVDGRLDPRIIGDAARTGRYDRQDLKKVWHCLARYGAES